MAPLKLLSKTLVSPLLMFCFISTGGEETVTVGTLVWSQAIVYCLDVPPKLSSIEFVAKRTVTFVSVAQTTS